MAKNRHSVNGAIDAIQITGETRERVLDLLKALIPSEAVDEAYAIKARFPSYTHKAVFLADYARASSDPVMVQMRDTLFAEVEATITARKYNPDDAIALVIALVKKAAVRFAETQPEHSLIAYLVTGEKVLSGAAALLFGYYQVGWAEEALEYGERPCPP